MAAPFLVGAVAGAATTRLLDDHKQPTIIHNVINIPLTEDQANLYMTTDEYQQYLNEKCRSLFLYIDKHEDPHPKLLEVINTAQKILVTFAEAQKLIEREKIFHKNSDKIILMTKGINALPKGKMESETCIEIRVAEYFCCFFCIPCMIANDCSDEPKLLNGQRAVIKIPPSTYQYILSLRA
ncbi:MAG: hypothetical protein K1060chlam5_00594 [Candidatus Anoxychlamydiales bacterium]|nr:hypothetical protein [Candidatus Anoxychlamydiales bacterium]